MLNPFTRSLMLVICSMVLCMGFLAGCDDSKEDTAATVNESGRLILSSNQDIIMTESEFNRSTQVAGRVVGSADDELSRGQENLADQIVDRATRDSDLATLEQEIAALDELRTQAANNPEQLRQLSQRLALTCELLVTVQEQIDSSTDTESATRLRLAEQKLAQAISASGSQAGPKLMLGTLHMMRARGVEAEVLRAAGNVELSQIEISRLLGALGRRSAASAEVQGYPPSEAIALLEQWLDGNDGIVGLREQLTQAQDEVQRLADDKQRLQADAANYEQQFVQLNQQYHAAIQQANQSRGQERFELSEQAYTLRTGSADDATSGASYYEAQYELTVSDLAIVQEQLDRALLKRDGLAESISDLEQRLEDLRDSDMFASSEDAVERLSVQQGELIARLQEVLTVEIPANEDAYSALRVQTVDLYGDAIGAFNDAARASGRDRNTREYAEMLTSSSQSALANMWVNDAAHYDAMSTILATLQDVPEIADIVAAMYADFTEKAQQARDAASLNEG